MAPMSPYRPVMGKEDNQAMEQRRPRHMPEQTGSSGRPTGCSGGYLGARVATQLEVSERTLHRWPQQCDGLKEQNAKRLKELGRESVKLKRMVAEQLPENRSRPVLHEETGVRPRPEPSLTPGPGDRERLGEDLAQADRGAGRLSASAGEL